MVAALMALALLSGCGGGDDDSDADTAAPVVKTLADPSDLAGIQTTPPPWPPELDNLRARLERIGIPALKVEGTALDVHFLVYVVVDGQPVEVPTSIGLNGEERAGRIIDDGFVSPVHTHDSSGLVHVHSTTKRPYTLGQFFDVWGVLFTDDCVSGLCAEGERKVRVFHNGQEQASGVRDRVVANQDVFVVAFGTADQLPSPLPAKFPS